ncbi:hypothetical protein DMI60_16675 [Escherichia coli]|nr:hypothetical protein [Escherichia coli]
MDYLNFNSPMSTLLRKYCIARAQRRSHNRLGFAIQLALVRALGRTLRTEKLPEGCYHNSGGTTGY